ncbi:MAG: FkbM family methyltransferase [Rhizobiaceae bacterium]|nr:FkbM family methyltransferase [Rhizobiaceae bacterium]MCV0404810.1 FkbM family methyltransferase [Rhizobiaceae bacterium]
MISPRAALGFARSLVIYRARPWRIARLAKFYRRFISPGDLAFDIGAHVGNRSLALASAGARVVALEPQSPFSQFLARTMPSAVTVLPLAAGPSEGEARLAVSSLHPTVSSMAQGFGAAMARDPGFRGVAWDSEQAVRATTLDALIARFGHPAFVKIDVEGFEADVLAGLSSPVRTIAFEALPAAPEVTRACVERLSSLGDYRFNLVSGERLAFALPEWGDGAAVLAAASDAARSGDVYARLAHES